MIQKPLDRIEKSDIDALITNAVQESKVIEYKEALPGRTDKEKKEFLADISSFANAAGGDILYGMAEHRDSNGKSTGMPEAANGLPSINQDAVILRLESMIRDGIAPRINGIQIRAIEGFTEGSVIILRVPNSWASPHMVTFKSISRFYSRTNGGKYPMDVAEIRSAFALSDTVVDKVKNFRDNRLASIIANETPLQLNVGAKIVFHILPIQSFALGTNLDMRELFSNTQEIWPIRSSGRSSRLNLDGVLIYSNEYAPEHAQYIQVFRSGVIEWVEGFLLRTRRTGKKLIPSLAFEKELIKQLGVFLKVQDKLAVEPPFIIQVSLLHIRGYELAIHSRHSPEDSYPIDRDVLSFPDILVESKSETAAKILRPVFDMLWQGAGFIGSQNYTAEGDWVDPS